MNPKVDRFLQQATRWRNEMETLRSIALDCGLREELKWGKPCYTFGDANVAVVQTFKARCAFLFFKGALLNDPGGLLERPGPHSHAGRRMMFSSVDQIRQAEPCLRAFVAEAIAVERAGRQVQGTKEPEPIPDELVQTFAQVDG